MKTVYSEDHSLHAGAAELHDGALVPCFESPRRAELILEHVRAADLGEIVGPDALDRTALARVHDEAYLEFLEGAWGRWVACRGGSRQDAAPDALPLVWPTRGFRQRLPHDIDGALSYYSFDAGTPITAGTWSAATSAARVALKGQRLVSSGERAAFALCRPPGHHAARDLYGGYCFLNNAAITAQAFRDAGAERVAVLDVDFHHGNGTQAIFYDRADVLFVSLHADPATDFPYFLGYADETGTGGAEGFNMNCPLPPGTAYAAYAEALDTACRRIEAFGPDVLVVSLGVDTFAGDPLSSFRIERDDFPRIGAYIARLGRPTLFVLEGGYAVEEIGVNVFNVLSGFEETA